MTSGVPLGEGAQIGHYRVERLLGRGNFGDVYQAWDTQMNRHVALKLIAAPYANDEGFRQRLQREARIAGRLNDPHVVAVHGCGEADGQLYLDMRLVDGTDLAAVLAEEGALTPERAVRIVAQIAEALDAAHSVGVVHRDVKPANILLTGDMLTADDFACLADFGVAAAAGEAKVTTIGATVGTFAYVAPERFAGAEITAAADVYGLACVLFECLTGAAPYSGDMPALVGAHISAPVPAPSRVRPGLPPGFDAVIATGMAKDPARRFPTAGTLAAAARAALAGEQLPVPPAAPSSAAHAGPPMYAADSWPPQQAAQGPSAPAAVAAPRRRRGLVIALAAVAAVVALLGGGAAWYSGVFGGASRSLVAQLDDDSDGLLPFPDVVSPWGIAVGGDGAVYVADRGNSGQDARILKLEPGASEPTVLLAAEKDGWHSFAAIAVDTAGNVYTNGARLTDSDFEYGVLKLAPGATVPEVLPFPNLVGVSGIPSVTVDSAGAVYTFTGDGRLLKLDAGANAPAELPMGLLNSPEGLAVDPQGIVYVSDDSNRVLTLAPGASAPTVFATGIKYSGSITIDPSGNVFVMGSDPGSEFDMTGVLKFAAGSSEPVMLPRSGLFTDIAAGPDGFLYTTYEYDDEVRKVPVG